MSKWFEVKIEIAQTVAVEVEDDQGEDEASIRVISFGHHPKVSTKIVLAEMSRP